MSVSIDNISVKKMISENKNVKTEIEKKCGTLRLPSCQ